VPSEPEREAPEEDSATTPVAPTNERTVEVERFVPRAQIDPAFFDKAYYIAPREPVGQEAFAVIRDAMREKGMVALGHVTLANRERPIAIETYGRGLRGFVLRHLHEVRSDADYFGDIPDMEMPADMLAVAKHILEAKAGDFDPAFLKDRYQETLVRMLRLKQAETQLPHGPVSPAPGNVVSLMDTLKRSMAAEGRVVLKPSPRRAFAKSKQTVARRRKAR
jgi:DNA end-binding protein Ku